MDKMFFSPKVPGRSVLMEFLHYIHILTLIACSLKIINNGKQIYEINIT